MEDRQKNFERMVSRQSIMSQAKAVCVIIILAIYNEMFVYFSELF